LINVLPIFSRNDELENVMSKIFVLALAVIAALFGSVVTWALTAHPTEAGSEIRALEAADTKQTVGRERVPNRQRGQNRSDFAAMTRGVMEGRLRERFAATDTNSDGFVTRSEAESAGESVRTKRRDFAFGNMDADKDGTVSRPEFEAQADARRAQFRQKRNKEFGVGQVSTQRRSIGYIGPRQVEQTDANKDGRISFDEVFAPALARFKSSDTDGDGVLTQKERRSGRQKSESDQRVGSRTSQ
jgi:EF-hand domain pair/EF hand